MSSLFANRPCLTCGVDRVHLRLACLECGTETVLKAVEFIHEGRRQQRGHNPVKPMTTAQRKAKWREKNRARAQLNRERRAAGAVE